MVLVKNWPYFFSFYFLPYRPRQCVSNIYERKKSSQTTKKEVQKTEQFRFFLKGLGHGFAQKLDILTFFL